GLVSPGLVSPGLVAPGFVSPGLVSPGLVSPGLVSPGLVSLGFSFSLGVTAGPDPLEVVALGADVGLLQPIANSPAITKNPSSFLTVIPSFQRSSSGERAHRRPLWPDGAHDKMRERNRYSQKKMKFSSVNN